MTREEQFLAVYGRCRVDDQLAFYKARVEEFTTARRQIALLAAVIFGLSSAVGVLAGLELEGKAVIAIFGVVLPAASTALTAYDALYGFERHAKLYADARRALVRLDPPEPEPEAVARYVESVEGVLRTEGGQWGQLAADLAVAPPAERPKDEP